VTYRIPLPEGGSHSVLDIVEPNTTAVQRALRRDGLSAYEPPTVAAALALMDLASPTFTFFDVGANMGLYALLAAAMFDGATVHAFEPTPQTVAVLEAAVAANALDIHVVQAAVAETNGTAVLHLSAASDASNSMVEGFKQSYGAVEVVTVSLDEHVRRTGVAPDIMKVDVETYEPAVLSGASETLATYRPSIIVEVLNRRGHDHGEDITRVIESYGYSCYELSARPTWEAQSAVRGRPASLNNDWLLTPQPLAPDFEQRWLRWRTRLDGCGPERNSRVPLMLSARAALRRGGVNEVYAAGRRYLAARRRERDRSTTSREP
jgi:FkbM family methyltransferase